MNYRMIAFILGRVLLILAALMLLPLVTALVYGESIWPFAATILATAACGGALLLFKPRSREIYAREGFITRVQALICERREPIEWARPDAELTLEEIRATFGLDAKSSEGGAGSLHSGGMQVGTAGGAARFVSESEPGFKLEKYLTGVPEPKEDEQSKPE